MERVKSLCTGGKMLFSWLFKVMLCPSKNSAQLREGNIKQGQCRLGLSVGSTAERESMAMVHSAHREQ